MKNEKESARKAFLLYGALNIDKGDNYDFLRKLANAESGDVHRLIAARDALKALRAIGESESADAVNDIYISQRKITPAASDITMAVRKFATDRYLDERTVYRRLKKAAEVYQGFLEGSAKCA